MPIITVELTNKELEALREYANLCKETVSELARKSLIREITLADGFGADETGYEYEMSIPSESPGSREHKIIEENYNKIRRILGWKEINL